MNKMKKINLLSVITLCLTVVLVFDGCSTGGTVERINNKPVQALPLAGMRVNEGIKMVWGDKVALVGLSPKLKVLAVYPNPRTGGDKIIIDKDKNLLYLYKQGELYKIYPVATGKKDQYTPEGNFKIANKIENDSSLKPQLGVRWMGLSVPWDEDRRAHHDERAPLGHKYGIHGTDEPDSIGKHASGGCIRVSNKQVVEIFDLVEEGTPVEIR